MKYLNTLTWEEVSDLDKTKVFCILPVSALEQHGPYLPLGTDDYILEYCLNILEKHSSPDNSELLILPTLAYGTSSEHLSFPGTVTLKLTTLMSIVQDIVESLSLHGINKFILFNSHGGNTSLLKALAQDLRFRLNVKVFNINLWNSSFFEPLKDLIQINLSTDIHAGKIETSLMKFAFPLLVKNIDLLAEDRTTAVSIKDFNNSWLSSDFSQTGILGNISGANPETGKKIADFIEKELIKILSEIVESKV